MSATWQQALDCSVDEAKAAVEAADIDGDGKVDYEEFLAIMGKQQPSHAPRQKKQRPGSRRPGLSLPPKCPKPASHSSRETKPTPRRSPRSSPAPRRSPRSSPAPRRSPRSSPAPRRSPRSSPAPRRSPRSSPAPRRSPRSSPAPRRSPRSSPAPRRSPSPRGKPSKRDNAAVESANETKRPRKVRRT